jgi:hypothetical protein
VKRWKGKGEKGFGGGGGGGVMSKLFFPKLKRVESMHNLQVDCTTTFTHNSFSHGI